MPQTLVKPVMLDETGQAIAGKLAGNNTSIADKLDDIKDAITTSGEFTPLMIKVTTPPIKTSYNVGELLDLTGMIVSLVAANGAMINVTEACTFSPSAGTALTVSDTSVSVSYYWYRDDVTFTTEYPIGVKDLSSITITTPPTKTAYKAGESLDLTGMVVTATYSDATSVDVTNRCTTSPASGDVLTTSDTTITVSYTEGSLTKTATQAIAVKEVASIAITNPPTQTTYNAGDALDLTGIEVTATYTDGSTADVTSLCTYNPLDGAILTTSNTSVTATFLESGLTKTATQAISVSYPIYGVEWDGTATTAWTRTDSASAFTDPVPQMSDGNGGWIGGSSPFDNIQPWAGMTIVNDTAGKFVQIPKFYYKLTKNGSALKIQICQSQREGFHVSPAHMDRGDGSGERNYVYVGRYHTGYSSGYKSQTGLVPRVYDKLDTVRSGARSIGTKYNCMDFATWFTIQLLYLVEFANWNSQAKIGTGKQVAYYEDTDVQAVGYTDSMTYHTGTTLTSRSSVGLGTQYRNIEGLWENVGDWLEGCGVYSYDLYLILNPSQFTSNQSEIYQRGINVGDFETLNNKIPSEVNLLGSGTNAFPLFSGAGSSGSATTYLCDTWQTKSGQLLIAGSSLGRTNSSITLNGLFALETESDSYKSYNLGYRLMKLP